MGRQAWRIWMDAWRIHCEAIACAIAHTEPVSQIGCALSECSDHKRVKHAFDSHLHRFTWIGACIAKRLSMGYVLADQLLRFRCASASRRRPAMARVGDGF